jgi:hypothetical protein
LIQKPLELLTKRSATARWMSRRVILFLFFLRNLSLELVSLKYVHTAKTKCRKFETNILRKGISGPQPNFHIHVSVSDGSAFSAGGNMWTDPGNI